MLADVLWNDMRSGSCNDDDAMQGNPPYPLIQPSSNFIATSFTIHGIINLLPPMHAENHTILMTLNGYILSPRRLSFGGGKSANEW